MTESNEATETEKAIIGGYVLVAVIALSIGLGLLLGAWAGWLLFGLVMASVATVAWGKANTPDAKGNTDA